MASVESILNAGQPAVLPADTDARRAAVLHGASRSQFSRRTMLQIHGFNAVFWAALFVMHTTQMMLARDAEDWRTMSWRAGLSVCAFALCLPLGALLRESIDWPFRKRLLSVAIVCVPIAFAYAALGHYVWTEVLRIVSMPYSVLAGIVIQAHYNFLLFILWSAFCAAILYAAQLQERERSLLEARALAHEAELKMLRYQINPHFLFNTLNAVSALVVTGQTRAAEEMIGKLSRFFRNALSLEATARMTLAEEMRVQQEYLDIELTRFADRVDLSTHLPADLACALVPHLILQPLYENAIKHGVACSVEPVEIRTTVSCHRDTLIVTIENDVRVASGGEQQPGEGVGLANVARRLAAFYGPAGTLSASRRDGRFVVQLRLPLEITL